ncbi:MAG: cation:proton antiporter [Bacilli bacterium]|nr:cation:proton antiporter [Bacilli bacterium]
MELPLFAYIAILLFAALMSTRLMKLIKLPNVTGYIITGIIMGPFVFGLLFNNFSYENIKESAIYTHVESIKWVSTIALGFIAFSIGTSFKLTVLKTVGKRVLVITCLEALLASVFVVLALVVAHFIDETRVPWELVLTLGAIASATAPAATLMVIKQYNAKGPLVNTLLPVVALDDAAALILFAILFQIALAIAGGNLSLYSMLLKPLIEIFLSLLVGLAIGFLISFMNRFFKSRNNRLIWTIFSVFSAVGVYYLFKQPQLGGFELSSLLMCMMAGAIYTNACKDSNKTLDVFDRFTAPIYMMFFVISGASLDLTIFFNGNGLIVAIIALVYIVFRVIGKYLGALTGASITHCEPQVKKYLGFTLIPQAGVAIGLATTANYLFTANEETKEVGGLIIAIVLTSTLIYELIGPLVSKYALSKAGEIEKTN